MAEPILQSGVLGELNVVAFNVGGKNQPGAKVPTMTEDKCRDIAATKGFVRDIPTSNSSPTASIDKAHRFHKRVLRKLSEGVDYICIQESGSPEFCNVLARRLNMLDPGTPTSECWCVQRGLNGLAMLFRRRRNPTEVDDLWDRVKDLKDGFLNGRLYLMDAAKYIIEERSQAAIHGDSLLLVNMHYPLKRLEGWKDYDLEVIFEVVMHLLVLGLPGLGCVNLLVCGDLNKCANSSWINPRHWGRNPPPSLLRPMELWSRTDAKGFRSSALRVLGPKDGYNPKDPMCGFSYGPHPPMAYWLTGTQEKTLSELYAKAKKRAPAGQVSISETVFVSTNLSDHHILLFEFLAL